MNLPEVPGIDRREEKSMSGLHKRAMARLGLVLILVATALPQRQACAAEPVKLRVSTISTIDSAPLEAAKAQGYFAAEGLEIDTTPMVGGAAGLPALAAGQVQIASSNLVSIILGAQQGLDFAIVAAGDATRDAPPDLAGLIIGKDSDIKTAKDLEGKKIGVNTRNNIIWLYARAWVAKEGGDPNKVVYREVPFPQMVDGVANGQVDAAFVVEPFLSFGLKSGAVKLLAWPYSAVQARIPISMFATSKAYATAHPDAIERFVRAYNHGVDWVDANMGTDAWFELIAGYTHLSIDKVKDLSPPLFPKTIDPAQVARVSELMRANGILDRAFDPATVLYTSVLTPPK